MSTYELPAEPDVDQVWTQDENGNCTPWDRVVERTGNFWRAGSFMRSWLELLSEGAVYDAHPILARAAGTPWRVGYGSSDEPELMSVRDLRVDLRSERNLKLIATAVNAYAEGLR